MHANFVLAGPARRRRVNPNEAELAQVKPVNEDLDHTNRILRFNAVVKTRGQQGHLGSLLAFDESLHTAALKKLDASV
jgi:hypothetical protein